MSSKITPDHLGRAAVVYVRQSTMAQMTGSRAIIGRDLPRLVPCEHLRLPLVHPQSRPVRGRGRGREGDFDARQSRPGPSGA